MVHAEKASGESAGGYLPEHIGEICLLKRRRIIAGNRDLRAVFRVDRRLGELIDMIQIHNVAAVTFEKSILRRETLLKGMKWFCGLYDIAGAQMKENSLILSFCVFNFMKIQFLITGDSFDHHVLWFFCK